MKLMALAQPLRLWVTDPHGERRVTWMELFFDLIFVAAVAQVGVLLAKDYSWAGLLRYAPTAAEAIPRWKSFFAASLSWEFPNTKVVGFRQSSAGRCRYFDALPKYSRLIDSDSCPPAGIASLFTHIANCFRCGAQDALVALGFEQPVAREVLGCHVKFIYQRGR